MQLTSSDYRCKNLARNMLFQNLHYNDGFYVYNINTLKLCYPFPFNKQLFVLKILVFVVLLNTRGCHSKLAAS